MFFQLFAPIFATQLGKKPDVVIAFGLFLEDGAVAQSVEQRTENPCVAGSIPAHTTIKRLSSNVGAFVFSNIAWCGIPKVREKD